MKKSVAVSIGEILSKAFCWADLSAAVKSKAEDGIIHDVILNFWFNGAPCDDRRCRSPFAKQAGAHLHQRLEPSGDKVHYLAPKTFTKRSLDNVSKTPSCQLDYEKMKKEAQESNTTIDFQEEQNKHFHRKFRKCNLHTLAFFTRFHVDKEKFDNYQEIEIWLSCQIQCNGRDIKRDNLIDNGGLVDFLSGKDEKANKDHVVFSEESFMFLSCTKEGPPPENAAIVWPTRPITKSSDDILNSEEEQVQEARDLCGSPSAQHCDLATVTEFFDLISDEPFNKCTTFHKSVPESAKPLLGFERLLDLLVEKCDSLIGEKSCLEMFFRLFQKLLTDSGSMFDGDVLIKFVMIAGNSEKKLETFCDAVWIVPTNPNELYIRLHLVILASLRASLNIPEGQKRNLGMSLVQLGIQMPSQSVASFSLMPDDERLNLEIPTHLDFEQNAFGHFCIKKNGFEVSCNFMSPHLADEEISDSSKFVISEETAKFFKAFSQASSANSSKGEQASFIDDLKTVVSSLMSNRLEEIDTHVSLSTAKAGEKRKSSALTSTDPVSAMKPLEEHCQHHRWTLHREFGRLNNPSADTKKVVFEQFWSFFQALLRSDDEKKDISKFLKKEPTKEETQHEMLVRISKEQKKMKNKVKWLDKETYPAIEKSNEWDFNSEVLKTNDYEELKALEPDFLPWLSFHSKLSNFTYGHGVVKIDSPKVVGDLFSFFVYNIHCQQSLKMFQSILHNDGARSVEQADFPTHGYSFGKVGGNMEFKADVSFC